MFLTILFILIFIAIPISCGLYIDNSISNQGMTNVVTVPIVEKHITDYANVLSNGDKVYLENLCKDLKDKTSVELAVVIVKNMSDNGIDNNKFVYPDIEIYAHEMFNKNGFGKKDKNNGILFLTSVGQRKTRIEVGYGLEGILNDGKCGRILDTYAIPYFKKNQFDVGVIETTKELVQTISPTSNKKVLIDEEAEAKRQELNLQNSKLNKNNDKNEYNAIKENSTFVHKTVDAEAINRQSSFTNKMFDLISEDTADVIYALGFIVSIFTSFLVLFGLLFITSCLYGILSYAGLFVSYPFVENLFFYLFLLLILSFVLRIFISLGILLGFGSGSKGSGGSFGGFGGGSSGGGGASRGF